MRSRSTRPGWRSEAVRSLSWKVSGALRRPRPARRILRRPTPGSLVYFPGPVGGLGAPRSRSSWQIAKGPLKKLKLPEGEYSTPRASPDGKQIAVVTNDGKEDSISLYDLSGASPMRRLTYGGNNRVPVWSPDGNRIAFQSDREGDSPCSGSAPTTPAPRND